MGAIGLRGFSDSVKAINVERRPHPSRGQVAVWGCKPRIRCNDKWCIFKQPLDFRCYCFQTLFALFLYREKHLEQLVNILEKTAPHPSLIHFCFVLMGENLFTKFHDLNGSVLRCIILFRGRWFSHFFVLFKCSGSVSKVCPPTGSPGDIPSKEYEYINIYFCVNVFSIIKTGIL